MPYKCLLKLVLKIDLLIDMFELKIELKNASQILLWVEHLVSDEFVHDDVLEVEIILLYDLRDLLQWFLLRLFPDILHRLVEVLRLVNLHEIRLVVFPKVNLNLLLMLFVPLFIHGSTFLNLIFVFQYLFIAFEFPLKQSLVDHLLLFHLYLDIKFAGFLGLLELIETLHSLHRDGCALPAQLVGLASKIALW